ncbi:MAG: slipin family protein [Candidatus Omnitrophica bacterium]|nr:slipin family protein [Candidatus Omnitrophota bacterium]MBU1133337.1 slipin family protein [Candidatus Omnitrophota bacterium]MBU1366221.1 slipin family protein [Candidatus Omnitrophota bacterium]MBU1523232.1 slipin family protein [Candidatus Omnitrophota bacterium]MBU2436412.1 slipin family protein [Candidatus Omnitrophota bacterium]
MPALAKFIFTAIALFIILPHFIRIIKDYERAVVFRLGRVLEKPKGPGIIFLIPGVDKVIMRSLRTVTLDVPPQDIITKDNVSVKVNAVIYYRVMDPVKSVIEVEDYEFATSQISQTTLRSVIGQAELDTVLSEREKINSALQEIIDKQTDPWGIKVSIVEIKHVDLPEEMRRAMARQAEAERERRGKVIAAEGEFQAADKLKQAAIVIADHPMALQMRYLQTLVEVSSEKSSIIVFPIPIDLFKVFMEKK